MMAQPDPSSGSATTCASPTTPRCARRSTRRAGDRAVRARRGVAPGIRPLGGAARWWLHHSLASLGERLRERGGHPGAAAGAAGSRRARDGDGCRSRRRLLEPALRRRRARGRRRAQVRAPRTTASRSSSFAARCCSSRGRCTTGAGTPFSVFTPFWRACLALPAPRAPLPEPREVRRAAPRLRHPIPSTTGRCCPTRPDWAGGLREAWEPGEPAARRRLREFLRDDLGHYDRARDDPRRRRDLAAVAAPALGRAQPAHGVARDRAVGRGRRSASSRSSGGASSPGTSSSTHPDLATRNLRREFDAFPWPRLKPTQLDAWQQRPHGGPARRRGHAGAVAHGLHAQPRADGRGILPRQEPAHRLAARRAVVLGHARRRRRREQPVQLAVGRGIGRGRGAVLPHLQPGAAGEEVRRGRALRARMGARAPHGGERPEPIVDLGETRKAALDAYEVLRRGVA